MSAHVHQEVKGTSPSTEPCGIPKPDSRKELKSESKRPTRHLSTAGLRLCVNTFAELFNLPVLLWPEGEEETTRRRWRQRHSDPSLAAVASPPVAYFPVGSLGRSGREGLEGMLGLGPGARQQQPRQQRCEPVSPERPARYAMSD